ncbi:NCS1 family nucleobase:cation symporter-1 [Paraneptunicella aestuarii]|uniref:NCS1 family nucleobase:cation symporter-1 n=1 Tax=Paraneptunicella aestuarii TaxID=2831148 RepID=UPI001E34ADC8|nr:NCS1 family nucleobase:cation symporter-1 [Paraneptunicella aestuarii]UAA38588.1 NCS1 family nucleobase:cation symporter-1 [Paraneptunicella aestuarii]
MEQRLISRQEVKSVAVKVGEFVELNAMDDLKESPLYNEDLAPTKVEQRTWHKGNVAALWVGMAICVPTYTLGGVLTAYFGLSVVEALLTILVANIIVLIPLTLNAFSGTKYGIPFPVLLRSSFGLYGSNLPCLIRAVVACGWFGIQTMFGGVACHLLLSSVSSEWAALGSAGEVYGFFMFWALNVFVVVKGSNSIKLLESWSAPLLLAVGLGLMFWALPQIDVAEIMATKGNRPEDASATPYLMAGVTAMVGFWATLSLNIPDFSRFVKSQKDQIVGQAIGLPLTMFFFAALGVVLTSASMSLVGETVSDPINLIGKIDNPMLVAIAMTLIIVATLSTNSAANVVSPTNDFQNIAPKYIGEKRGVFLTGFIGILMMSWELLKKMGWIESDVSVEALYSNWLLGYSSLLGPIAGIMIVDYFIVNKQQLDLVSLYKRGGRYADVNYQGMAAFLIPVGLTLYSILTGNMHWFYDYGWFTGSLMGGLIYYALKKQQAIAAQ